MTKHSDQSITTENSKTKKIHVSGLQVGMYVAKLDVDWLQTPFLYQGFFIESIEDIEQLEKYCQYVWVDHTKDQQSRHPSHIPNKSTLSKTKKNYVNKAPMSQEYSRSYNAFTANRQKIKALLEEATLGNAIDTDSAKETVQHCLNSVLRNPNAMLWMSKIRGADEYTSEHCLNVCILAIAFGRHLGKSEDELEELGLCGLLHDVGKMRVPNQILHKPAKLTPKEWKIMKAHTVHGRNLLMSSENIGQTVEVAYSHHERVDGKGYPRGLEAHQISEYAKIIAIVDAYDAMTAERCYSKAIKPSVAIRHIYNDRGTHFDETLALQFIKAIGLYPPGCIVELVNGSVGIVLERHSRFQHLPRVLLVLDQDRKIVENTIIDLSLIEQGELDRSLLIKKDYPDGEFDIQVRDFQDFILAIA